MTRFALEPVEIFADGHDRPRRWMDRFSRKIAGVVCLILILLCSAVVIGAGLLGGTVLSIDKELRQVTIQMPEGHASHFPAADDGVLKDIKVGDRVSITLDHEGRVTKFTKLPIDHGN